MRQVKVYNPDTTCEQCERQVNRKRAEAEDWIEVIYVDQTGMPISKAVVCSGCAENWHPDAYVPAPGTTAPGTTAPAGPANLPDGTNTPIINSADKNASTLATLAGPVVP